MEGKEFGRSRGGISAGMGKEINRERERLSNKERDCSTERKLGEAGGERIGGDGKGKVMHGAGARLGDGGGGRMVRRS